jgi:hypothetical protein
MTKTTFDAVLHSITVGVLATMPLFCSDQAKDLMSPGIIFGVQALAAFLGAASGVTIAYRNTSYGDSLPPDAAAGPDLKAIADHVNKVIDDRVIPIKNSAGDHVATAITAANPAPTGP